MNAQPKRAIQLVQRSDSFDGTEAASAVLRESGPQPTASRLEETPSTSSRPTAVLQAVPWQTVRPETDNASGAAPAAGESPESVGRYLSRERALRGMSLEELAQVTRIPVRSLQLLESDRYDALPSDVFVRGFLRAYARALGLDGDDLLEQYAEGRRSAPPLPAALPAIAPPERGRRFGIAIALVILLILFTLALSIVLQPRHRDAPIELSTLPRIEVPWSPELISPVRPCSSAPSTMVSATASSRV